MVLLLLRCKVLSEVIDEVIGLMIWEMTYEMICEMICEISSRYFYVSCRSACRNVITVVYLC